jgi:hypothetical protein
MADLKTWNGVTRANVKTFDGLASASWKTWNGLNTVTATGPAESQDSYNSTQLIAAASGYYYSGQGRWSNASARTINKIAFNLTKSAGSISAKTYSCKIWTMTGTYNLDVLQATSDGVTGDNGWSSTWVEFTFSTPFPTTGGVAYAFTLDIGGTDGSNYASLSYSSSVSTFPGGNDYWNSGKAAQLGASTDCAIRIWY